MPTFHCTRVTCRYCKGVSDCTAPVKDVTININGDCSAFQKGVWYYIAEVKSIMGDSNMIPSLELTTASKIGIYFITMIYGLSYAYHEYGSWGWVAIYDKNNSKEALTMKEILNGYRFNEDNYNLFLHYIETSKSDKELIEKITGKVAPEEADENYEYDFGFITPTGDFISENEWGEHENLAFSIIRKNKWENEWAESCDTGVDFLIYTKHYVLIHAPNGVDITVTKGIKLTKKQKEFLYDYFYKRGMGLRASLYMED